MRRLALRYYLPIVQVVFLLCLVSADQVRRYEAAHRPPTEVGWEFRTIHEPNIYADAFAILNAPAISLVVPFLLVTSEPNEWLLTVALALAVVIFWYGLGLFFDRKRGLLPARPPQKRGRWWWILAVISLIVAAVAAGIGVFLLATESGADVAGLALVGWPLFWSAMLIRVMAGSRPPKAFDDFVLKL